MWDAGSLEGTARRGMSRRGAGWTVRREARQPAKRVGESSRTHEATDGLARRDFRRAVLSSTYASSRTTVSTDEIAHQISEVS